MKNILTLIFAFFLTYYLKAQNSNFDWVKQIGDSLSENSFSIATDDSGNVYSTGAFKGVLDIDPGLGTFIISSNPLSTYSTYLLKLDVNGNFKWVRQFDTGIPYATHMIIKLDPIGNIYATGAFSGTLDFDPGSGVYNLVSPSFYDDIFVLKLNSTGDFVWAKHIGGIGGQIQATSIEIDNAGNALLTGGFNGTVDFNPGNASSSFTTNGDYAVFITKLDSSGNFQWAKTIGGNIGNANECGYSIDSDQNRNVYVTGKFGGTEDFNPGAGVFNLVWPFSNENIFVLKLNSTGGFVWAKGFMGINNSRGLHIAVDINENVYTSGFFDYTVDFDPGNGVFNLYNQTTNPFICKLDVSGNFVWARNFSASRNNLVEAMKVDASGNIYATGYFSDTLDVDPGVGVNNIVAIGVQDGFILKLNNQGNFLWAKSIGGSLATVFSTSLTLDTSGNIYTSGSFTKTVDFDPGVNSVNLTSQGITIIYHPPHSPTIHPNTDIYIQKLVQNSGSSLGVYSNDIFSQIKTFPNPAGNRFQVQYLNSDLKGAWFFLYDVLGNVVLQQRLTDGTTHINTLHLQNAAYFYKVIDEEGVLKRGKIVVDK